MGQRLNPFGVLQVVHLVRQDLSIAGKRAGLAGARSGLFMEQVRIVKEMREADKRAGRTGDMVRPRYLVWENVCFAGDTLVATRNGYKRIDQIAVGDEVKTHTGQYRPVAKTMRTRNQAVVRLKVSGAEDIICTPNHPLYVMEKNYADAGKKRGRSFTEPRWEAAGNLNERCMVAYKLDAPTLPEDFIMKDEAWALGRYIADGSVDLNRGTPRIFISVGNAKLEEAREHLHRLPYEIHENAPHATATNMVFTSQEFYNLVSGVGKGAGNKRVPPFVFDLPAELQRCVLNGYISGDGYIRHRGESEELCCGTASRELAYGIARMIRNVYRVGANVSVRKPKDGVIDGRTLKANYPCYCVTASLTSKVSVNVCKDGFMWQMVKDVEPCREKVDVYNLSVWEDNTYGANDVVAHNCGAFSSNKGKDFAAVLEEIIKIVEPEAPGIEVPEKGWPTWGGYHDEVGGRWSVVWRTHDSQYWGKTIRDSRTGDVLRLGTPQRRRRISVVADFGGDTASEIQFDVESLSGDIAAGGTAGEGPAEAAEGGFNPTVARSLTARADGSPCADRGPNIVCSPHQGGCDGGGKGALVQTEKSGTLGCGNDQTIFCLQGNGIDRADTAGCNGKGWREDACYTLNTIDRPAVCAAFKLGNSEQARSIGYQEELSPTLNAECGGNKPAVVAPAVALDMTHACDVIRECGEQVPALQARMGTGGNQVPLTYQMNGFGDYRDADVASSCKQRDFKDSTDLVCSMTPDAAQAVLYQPKSAMEENWAASETKNALRAGESKVSHAVVAIDCRNGHENDVGGALQARTGHTLNANGVVRQNMVVRRLTPLECERLQGFPDKWTDIGEWTDEKGKKHKDADSPRYKALGNSIALPFWEWMLRRMAQYLPEGATLGSLFDGISGFNVCWARIHGAQCCRWGSEIEQFPIAVVKKHFGDEEAGKEGDFEKFFGRNKKENV